MDTYGVYHLCNLTCYLSFLILPLLFRQKKYITFTVQASFCDIYWTWICTCASRRCIIVLWYFFVFLSFNFCLCALSMCPFVFLRNTIYTTTFVLFSSSNKPVYFLDGYGCIKFLNIIIKRIKHFVLQWQFMF